MDLIELQLKDEILKLYKNIPSDELENATSNLISFYKLVVNIMQENEITKIPENNSELIEK